MTSLLRLLLIEDVEDDALLLIHELRRQALTPSWMRVMTEAELRAALAAETWDIVLGDYSLPGFGAMEALRVVQESGLDIPFLVISGTINDAQVVSALMAGARDFIDKSSMARLMPAIRRELSEAAMRRERRIADERLAQSERYFRALIERATDLIVVLSADGLIQDVSPAIMSMLGYSREDLIGRNISWLISSDDRGLAESALSDLLAGAPLSHSLTLRAGHKGGGQRTLEITMTNLLADPAVSGLVINARDVTRQAEAESQLRRQAARAEALVQLASRLNANLDRDRVIDATCDAAARSLGADMAYVILPTPHASPQVVGSAGPGIDVLAQLMPTMPHMLGQLLAGAEPQVTHTPGSTSREFVWRAYSAPMVRDGYHTGALVITFADGALPISADNRALLGAIADQAGLALHNAELLAELQRSNAALADAYDATLEGWVHALDLRDKETEGHTRRVTAITLRLARAMGFDDEALTQIYRGSLLHDIGKMGIPDRILHKPGPLDVVEWALMRMHPIYAYEWLYPIPFLRLALDIPYCHHEKWDGSGYPRGIQGVEIPLSARIFALVDIWDALRSERPYKPAYPEEHAIQLIREQAGSHLDPAVVALFLQMLPELREPE